MNMAGRRALTQHKGDLFVGHRRRPVAVRRQEAQHKICRGAQDPFDRRPNAGEHPHGSGDHDRDALGMHKRNPFGDELAQDQREIRDADHDDCHADGIRVTREPPPLVLELALQLVPQCGFAEGAGEDRNHGDADLDSRQQTRGVRFELERR